MCAICPAVEVLVYRPALPLLTLVDSVAAVSVEASNVSIHLATSISFPSSSYEEIKVSSIHV